MIHELIMPKMGESITEATILKWLIKVGEPVYLDQAILEIATDKVDSEIQSPAAGILTEILYRENDIIPVGEVIAFISDQNGPFNQDTYKNKPEEVLDIPEVKVADEEFISPVLGTPVPYLPTDVSSPAPLFVHQHIENPSSGQSSKNRFYSPLVRTIAKQENITTEELDSISGTGDENRVTKSDILQYIDQRQKGILQKSVASNISETPNTENKSISLTGGNEIIEMDRMGRLIADHMLMSKQTSPHVTSFIEVDVTKVVQWREKNKKNFQEKYKQNITYTPLFLMAVIEAIKTFPLINSSLNGYQITLKKDINIGMATALTNGNLIVPVIKKADLLSLHEMVNAVNDMANRSRLNQLKPDEVMGGTFTVTNIGSFDSLMGTPIINQPQVAILAIGSIKKKPIVIESTHGDVIGIGHCMFMSLSYDHRIINGFLGGSFLKRIADLLESFDPNTSF